MFTMSVETPQDWPSLKPLVQHPPQFVAHAAAIPGNNGPVAAAPPYKLRSQLMFGTWPPTDWPMPTELTSGQLAVPNGRKGNCLDCRTPAKQKTSASCQSMAHIESTML